MGKHEGFCTSWKIAILTSGWFNGDPSSIFSTGFGERLVGEAVGALAVDGV
jgi:hypothetical protein